MRDILIILIVFGSLPYILARPYIGILMWSWLGYMNPHRLSWGFAYDFPFAQIVAITLMVAIAFSRERKRVPVTTLTAIWWLFILWMTLSTLFAIFPEDAQAQYIKVIKIQLIIFFTLILMGTKERLHLLVWIMVISLGYFGVKGGIFTLLTAGNFRVWGPPDSFIEGNNELALALLMILPLMQYLRMQSNNIWGRRGLLLSMALCGISAAGSYSRGAFLAAFSMAVFLWLKSARKVTGGIALVVAFPLVFAFMPTAWHERMDTINTYEEDASAMGRVNAWHYAFNLANDRFLGAGFESWTRETFAVYAPVPDDVHQAHSIYFGVLADHGWVGLIMFLSIFLMAWRNGTWVIRRVDLCPELRWLGDLSRMIQVSLVAYATGGAFLSLSYFDLPWHLVAIMVLSRSIAVEQLKHLGVWSNVKNVSASSPQLSAR